MDFKLREENSKSYYMTIRGSIKDVQYCQKRLNELVEELKDTEINFKFIEEQGKIRWH